MLDVIFEFRHYLSSPCYWVDRWEDEDVLAFNGECLTSFSTSERARNQWDGKDVIGWPCDGSPAVQCHVFFDGDPLGPIVSDVSQTGRLGARTPPPPALGEGKEEGGRGSPSR